MGGSSLESVGHATAPLQTMHKVPKAFKQGGLRSAAVEVVSLVAKPIFALPWAGLLYICFSLFPGSRPSMFVSRLCISKQEVALQFCGERRCQAHLASVQSEGGGALMAPGSGRLRCGVRGSVLLRTLLGRDPGGQE